MLMRLMEENKDTISVIMVTMETKTFENETIKLLRSSERTCKMEMKQECVSGIEIEIYLSILQEKSLLPPF